MPVDTRHHQYDLNEVTWRRARDVLSGEDAVKARGELYLPRIEAHSPDEYEAYKSRASFFNATARTADGFLGLIFRRAPVITSPKNPYSPGAQVMRWWLRNTDLFGSTLTEYARRVVSEVISVGRAGTLVTWSNEARRPFAVCCQAEDILNWRVEWVRGREALTLVTLRSWVPVPAGECCDRFRPEWKQRLRVLELVDRSELRHDSQSGPNPVRSPFPRACQIELWEQVPRSADYGSNNTEPEWELIHSVVPQRRGETLPFIPFVFHGPRHSLPWVDKLPLADLIAVNLDHYRLDADYKHGLHYTAMPTIWVTGFEQGAELKGGASTAWVTENTQASAGYLEFKGRGLQTFERALDRDERLMTLLGSRLLEDQKRVGETAETIALRQNGEDSILANLARSLSASLTQALRLGCWWCSQAPYPDELEASEVGAEAQEVRLELNTDFSVKGLSARELEAIVASWQANALSRESMLDLFRRGEVLPEGRTDQEENEQIEAEARGLKVADEKCAKGTE